MITIHNFSKYTQFHRKWCIPTRISLATAIRIHSPFDFECGFGCETTENVLKSTVDSANVFFTNNPPQMWFLQCKIATLRAFLSKNSTQTVFGVGDAHSWPIDLTYRFISDFVRICFRFLLQLERDWKLFRTSDLRRSLKDNSKAGEKNMIWSQSFLVFLWRPLRQSFQYEINTFRKLVCGKMK